MTSTLDAFNGLMKEKHTSPDMVDMLLYPDNVFFGRLTKKTDMVGTDLKVPIVYGHAQGVGGTMTGAIAGAAGTGGNLLNTAWAITAGSYFGVVDVDDKVIEATRNNDGAYLEALEVDMDSVVQTTGESLNLYAWGNGGYSSGTVASIDTNDITLTNPSDIQNFEIGMYVRESANDGSDTSHTLGTGTTYVTAINPSTGVITVNSGATLSDISAGHHLFRSTDFFGDVGTVILKGVQSFCTADDTPPALWGISAATRLTNLARFSGCRLSSTDASGKDIEERIKLLHAQMTGRFKAQKPTEGFLHPEDFDMLDTLMAGRGTRDLDDIDTKFGYQSITVQTPSGSVKIYSDRHTPRGHYFAFRMDNLWISSMGPLIKPMDKDGQMIRLVEGTTTYRYIVRSYPLLANNAPKNLGRCPLPAAA